MRNRGSLISAVGFALLGATSMACGGSARHADAGSLEQGEMAGAVIPLEIQNDNMQDVNVYLLHGGVRSRIGIAGAATSTTLMFPARYSSGATTVQLMAVPLIGGRFGFRHSILSDPITVHAGQKILFNLESDLSRSTIGVYALDVLEPADSAPPATKTDSSTGSEAPTLATIPR